MKLKSLSLESITSRIKAVEDCMVIHKDSIKKFEKKYKKFYISFIKSTLEPIIT